MLVPAAAYWLYRALSVFYTLLSLCNIQNLLGHIRIRRGKAEAV